MVRRRAAARSRTARPARAAKAEGSGMALRVAPVVELSTVCKVLVKIDFTQESARLLTLVGLNNPVWL